MKRLVGSLTPALATTLLLIALILVGLAYRANNLNTQSLWLDEIGQVIVSRDGFLSTIRGAGTHFGAMPLDYEITDMIVRTVGQGEAVLRLPAVVSGSAAIALIYWLGVSLFSSRLVGLVSAALMAKASTLL